jgi:Mn-containing catalase
LLNREEAHNQLFRDAFNKVQDTGSNKSFGVTKDSKIYFNLSSPSQSKEFEKPDTKAPSFK